MSRYTNISNDVWSDKEFKKLSPIGKNVYFFILTNPQGNQAGIYRLGLDLVEFYLGKEGAEEIKQGSKLWKYDEENEVVFLPNYLKYNTAKSVQQIGGIARNISTIPYCNLLVDFMESLIKYSGEEALKHIPAPIRDYSMIKAKAQGREALMQSLINYAFY